MGQIVFGADPAGVDIGVKIGFDIILCCPDDIFITSKWPVTFLIIIRGRVNK